MNNQQILDFTSGFPPAQKLTQILIEIDYKKYFNQYMDFVITFCAVIAAVYTVLRNKWIENNVTERLQVTAETIKVETIRFYNWNKDVSIPFIQETAIPAVIDTINEIRSYFNTMKLVQFAWIKIANFEIAP